MAVEVLAKRRRFRRAEYYRMVEAGILGERDRVFVGNLNQLLVTRLAGRVIVWVHSSIALAEDTEPQPDLAVLRRGAVSYKERDAWAEDALLVIEVADSSLAYDRSTKPRLYAEAGIPEYWVVDCAAETVEVHRGPGPDSYREVTLVAGVATLRPQAFPDVELRTTDIFA